MAGLDARTDSFVSMLLDVTGRVRPGDLPTVSEFDLPATLQAYVDAHPERQLSLDGSVLTFSGAAGAPAAPATPAAPVAPAAPIAPAAPAAPIAAVEPVAPAAMVDSAAPAAAVDSAAPADAVDPFAPPAFDQPVVAPVAPESFELAETASEPTHELVFQSLPLDDTPETAPPPPSAGQLEETPDVDPASWFIAPDADLAPPEGTVIAPEPGDQPGPSHTGSEAEKSYEF